jgi:hypothetical protein
MVEQVSGRASARRLAWIVWAALLALGLPARPVGASETTQQEGAGGLRFEQRTELRDELSGSQASASLLNPEGRVYRDDGYTNRLRLRTNAKLSWAGFTLKGRGVAEVVHADGQHRTLEGALPELYLHRSVGGFELSAGRKLLRWSNGYAFAPAGLLDPARDPADPQDRLGRSEGRDVLQVDTYRGAHTLSAVFGVGGVLPAASSADRPVLALRYHVLVRGLDFTLLAARRTEEKDALATSLSYVLGSRLELHAEASATRGSDLLLPQSILPGQQQTLFGNDFYAPVRAESRALLVRWLLGFNLTLPGGLNLVGEYFHAPDGLAGAEWERFLAQARFSAGLLGSSAFPPVFGGRSLPEVNLLQAMQGLGRPGLGRDYLFVRLAHTRLLRRAEASALALVNLRDRSLVAVPEVSVTLQRRVSAYLRGNWFTGRARSEFGNVPIGVSGTFGLRLSF